MIRTQHQHKHESSTTHDTTLIASSSSSSSLLEVKQLELKKATLLAKQHKQNMLNQQLREQTPSLVIGGTASKVKKLQKLQVRLHVVAPAAATQEKKEKVRVANFSNSLPIFSNSLPSTPIKPAPSTPPSRSQPSSAKRARCDSGHRTESSARRSSLNYHGGLQAESKGKAEAGRGTHIHSGQFDDILPPNRQQLSLHVPRNTSRMPTRTQQKGWIHVRSPRVSDPSSAKGPGRKFTFEAKQQQHKNRSRISPGHSGSGSCASRKQYLYPPSLYHVFSKHDGDNDGYLSRRDFLRLYENLSKTGRAMVKEICDSEGWAIQKKVTYAEFKQMIHREYPKLSMPPLAADFAACPENEHGSISVNQVVQVILSSRQFVIHQFDEVDEDDDGFISFPEFRVLMRTIYERYHVHIHKTNVTSFMRHKNLLSQLSRLKHVYPLIRQSSGKIPVMERYFSEPPVEVTDSVRRQNMLATPAPTRTRTRSRDYGDRRLTHTARRVHSRSIGR
mmetsp:Transcript_2345/g.4307  ORF Transcript_2345/g.4307 Transcript_2345/m.4307 type:complete len:503 (-) Transcript_2345:284-1792(-)